MENARRLAFFEPWFERWSNPNARELVDGQHGIALIGLDYDAPESDNWTALASAHGYQIAPQVELQQPWYCNRELIERCPDLLAVCSTGAGYDVVDVVACSEAGIVVCNQAGGNSEAVAEHALAMMIALSKKIVVSDRMLRRGEPVDRHAIDGRNIQGKTIGIIGLGNIGGRTAELCSGLFAMTVLAYDPYLDADEILARHASKVDLDELLRRSDFVSVHCPRTSETLGMIGRRQFAAMKPGAYFVSTARGGIHDEDALAAALIEGHLAGAGLDVFAEEPPPPTHPLLALDNVIATPHLAGTTAESKAAMAIANARQWIQIFSGERPPRLVNPEAWPRYARRFEESFGIRPLPIA